MRPRGQGGWPAASQAMVHRRPAQDSWRMAEFSCASSSSWGKSAGQQDVTSRWWQRVTEAGILHGGHMIARAQTNRRQKRHWHKWIDKKNAARGCVWTDHQVGCGGALGGVVNPSAADDVRQRPGDVCQVRAEGNLQRRDLSDPPQTRQQRRPPFCVEFSQ